MQLIANIFTREFLNYFFLSFPLSSHTKTDGSTNKHKTLCNI